MKIVDTCAAEDKAELAESENSSELAAANLKLNPKQKPKRKRKEK